jgi:nitric oxide reductase NorD protein
MAEAEDVLTDVARHATEFAQQLWRRHSGPASAAPVRLADVSRRLELLLSAAFGQSFTLRAAQPPAEPTWLARWMARRSLPAPKIALPATDGQAIWLPRDWGTGASQDEALSLFRLHALRQGMRALRAADAPDWSRSPRVVQELYLLLEARAADDALARRFPPLAGALEPLRGSAQRTRPPLERIPVTVRPLEMLAASVLAAGPAPVQGTFAGLPLAGLLELPAPAAQVLLQAQRLHEAWQPTQLPQRGGLLWHDLWTGELRPADKAQASARAASPDGDEDETQRGPPRSARLARRPEVRQAPDDEDDEKTGAWMVQSAQPNEAAEDPMGLQRPTDRDASTASEDFADALSELPEARLVSTPGKPKEVLLSDDPPDAAARRDRAHAAQAAAARLQYPEWDWRTGSYRIPGATVLLQPCPQGPMAWVERILSEHAGMLHEIRRRFELLRAHRQRLRKQLDGHDIDLDAWCEAQADFRAGRALDDRLYVTERRARRDLAITLLVDISGSTDSWVSEGRRVIDVEREALLLVCIALEGLSDPYEVLAFSGEGPHGVVVRPVKKFSERYGADVARRIASLEPEHYTRCGAALRHATENLMRQPASHRLLLLLSDGRPNDIDEYEGRYGVEDTRQAVAEARLQGISTFCLTIDRQAANYLPAVFGPHHYALLPHPGRLPGVLLDWLRKLVST